MIIDVEVCSFSLNLLHAHLFENGTELGEYQSHSLTHGFSIFCLVGKSALEVIEHWEYLLDGLLASREDEVSLLLDCALAIVVKFSLLVEHFILQLLYLSLSLCQRVSFFCRFFGVTLTFCRIVSVSLILRVGIIFCFLFLFCVRVLRIILVVLLCFSFLQQFFDVYVFFIIHFLVSFFYDCIKANLVPMF